MYLFTASQISEIRRLRNNGPINGNYSHIYEYIASILPQGTAEQRWFSGVAPQSASPTTRIAQFDFSALTAAFDAARAENPSLSRWALSSSLLQFHLGGSDNEAIGGDIAYEYGKHGSLTGLSLNAVQAAMADPSFGSQRQKLSLYNVT